MKLRCAAVAAAVSVAVVAPPGAQAHFYKGCKKNPCKRHVVKPFRAGLERMAGCESGHRWFIHGVHEGGLQFAPSTWDATGSRYSAAHLAPKLEQMYRAVIWASMINWRWQSNAGWPHCGRYA